jgi:Zn-dependent peptidase ImmA (M78 family)
MEAETSSKSSPLCDEFARRVGFPSGEEAMEYLADGLRKRSVKLRASSVEALCKLRDVSSVDYLDAPDFDGILEPLGESIQAGFKIQLNRSMSRTRMQFTLLHELMHTFFYEYVPEKKFASHPTDPSEERLCNLGAAHFLLPPKELRTALKHRPVCLKTAEDICEQFQVSLPTFVVRVRQLKLWKVELSTWIKLSSGKVVLDKSIGGLGKGWSWIEDREIDHAFRSTCYRAGKTYLIRQTKAGDNQVKRINYDLVRRGQTVQVLSGASVTGSSRGRQSLFNK